MENGFYFTVAATIILALLPFVTPMPKPVAWAGIFGAVVVMMAELAPVERRPSIWVVVLFISGLMALAGAGYVYFDQGEPTKTVLLPNISFPKYGLFWVQTEPNIYWLGVVIKLFNLDSRPYLINGVTIEKAKWRLIPRGGYNIQRYTEFSDQEKILEDNYIKAGDAGYYKKLLPIRIEITVIGGDAPDFALTSRWHLLLGEAAIPIEPQFYGAYEKFLSQQEWDDLLKPKSKIDIENLNYKPLTGSFAATPPVISGH